MILISPYAKALPSGRKHPKNYPYWPELIDQIQKSTSTPLIQVGISGEPQLLPDYRVDLTLEELGTLVDSCKLWISVDSFFQHFCWDRGKYGIVLWGQSDPNIFGHPENINLLKDRKYLRKNQFWLWEQCEANDEAFVRPEIVLNNLVGI